MIETPRFFAFALTALLVELTPGPNMGYLAAVASRHGARVGLAVVGGIAGGLSMLVVVSITGLSRFILGDQVAFQLVRWTGVGYMFWLAIEALRQRPQLDPTIIPFGSNAMYVVRGLVTNLFNVKALLFLATILPTFMSASPGQDTAQAFILGATYVGIATLVHTGIALAFSGMATARLSLLNSRYATTAYFVVLLAMAIWLAFATSSDAAGTAASELPRLPR